MDLIGVTGCTLLVEIATEVGSNCSSNGRCIRQDLEDNFKSRLARAIHIMCPKAVRECARQFVFKEGNAERAIPFSKPQTLHHEKDQE